MQILSNLKTRSSINVSYSSLRVVPFHALEFSWTSWFCSHTKFFTVSWKRISNTLVVNSLCQTVWKNKNGPARVDLIYYKNLGPLCKRSKHRSTQTRCWAWKLSKPASSFLVWLFIIFYLTFHWAFISSLSIMPTLTCTNRWRNMYVFVACMHANALG